MTFDLQEYHLFFCLVGWKNSIVSLNIFPQFVLVSLRCGDQVRYIPLSRMYNSSYPSASFVPSLCTCLLALVSYCTDSLLCWLYSLCHVHLVSFLNRSRAVHRSIYAVRLCTGALSVCSVDVVWCRSVPSSSCLLLLASVGSVGRRGAL